jgi:hypothetical protein
MDWAAAMVFAEEMKDDIVLRSPPTSQPSNQTSASPSIHGDEDVCSIRKVRSPFHFILSSGIVGG